MSYLNISTRLAILTTFCQSQPELINHLDEFPKLYKFATNYPTLIEHAEEAASAYELMRECQGMSNDEIKALMRLARTLKGASPEIASENDDGGGITDGNMLSKIETTKLDSATNISTVKAAEMVPEALEDNADFEHKNIQKVSEDETEAPKNSMGVESEVSEFLGGNETDNAIAETPETGAEELVLPETIQAPKTEVTAAQKRRKLASAEKKKIMELIERGYSYRQISKILRAAKPYSIENFLNGRSTTLPIEVIEQLNSLNPEEISEKPSGRRLRNREQETGSTPEEPA